MKNTKGMEISINFIVVLILSIVVFAGGIALLTKIVKMANDKQIELDTETQQEIEKLLADGSQVAIPVHTKSAKIGDSVIYGLGIQNTLPGPPKNFSVKLSFKSAFDRNNELIAASSNFIDNNWHFYFQPVNYSIKHNEYITVPLMIKANGIMMNPDVTTNKGLYIFDVNVSVKGQNGRYYDGHVHKIYLQVE